LFFSLLAIDQMSAIGLGFDFQRARVLTLKDVFIADDKADGNIS